MDRLRKRSMSSAMSSCFKSSVASYQVQSPTEKDGRSLMSLRDLDASFFMDSDEYMIPDEPKGPKFVDAFGVRIYPAVVKFNNTFENQRYTELVSVQNISEAPVTVRIHNPRAWSFRTTPLERGCQLASGLRVTRRLTYTCTKNGVVHSTLPIYINEDLFELPLEGYKSQVFVDITPTTINFGRLDIGCKPVLRKILIKNMSYCATKFLVDVGANELNLHVEPLKGWIRPNSSVTILVQLIPLHEGVYSSELWITTDLCQSRIQVEMEACRRHWIVLHPNTISDFTLVDFPMTFYGCRRYQTLVVYNMAASSSAFVVLADFGSKGLMPIREAKKQDASDNHVKMFDVEPSEGRIRAFEERIFTFWFNPQAIEGGEKLGWKSRSSEDNDFLCAVRIKRINVEDVGVESHLGKGVKSLTGLRTPGTAGLGNSPSVSNLEISTDKETEGGGDAPMDRSLLEDVSVLLYLYGEAETPILAVTPNILHFPNTPVGTTVIKVVQLTNNTSQMLAYQYSKMPFFEVIPDFKKIAPKTSYDVTVKLSPRNIGSLKRDLMFDILAQENATDKQDFRVVNQIAVRISGNVKAQAVALQPKFNPGITPLITNEVGFLTDEVTFASKVEKPRCAVTVAARRGRPWHRTDAVIAFPNDRPLTLRPRATDAVAKTIYKGLTRYVAPVDESLTFTVEQLIKKKAHDEWFLNYIRGTAAVSVSKERCCKWRNPRVEPDPPLVLKEKKRLTLPCEVFVPLTFVQLYRIKVYPPVINFGSVTTSKCCTQTLGIENGNDFKISAKIIPLTTGISIQTFGNFTIPADTDAKVVLTFQRETLGKYSGTVTCIINGYHSVDIAVVAEVVHRSLTISPERVEIKIPDVPFASSFIPISINNPLNIPVTFTWVIPEESPIKIEPIIGVKPSSGTIKAKSCFSLVLTITVLFEKALDFTIYLTLQNTATIEMRVTGTIVYPEVEFSPQYINLHRVPCNSVTRTAMLAENKSKTKVEVGFEMDEYPQFKMSLSKRHHDPGLKGSFTLEPGASQKLFLHFIPRDLASYDFYLPIVLNNLIYVGSRTQNPPKIKDLVRGYSCANASRMTMNRKTSPRNTVTSHMVLVDVVVLKASLIISDMELNFSHTSQVESFTVKNTSEQAINIVLRSEEYTGFFYCKVDAEEAVKDRSSFRLTVHPGYSITYTATYLATHPGVHVMDVSILTGVDDNSTVYNIVRLTGTIPLPCVIVPSVKEIYFQPVPLNVDITYIFYLKIYHHQKKKETLINYELGNPNLKLFTVEFPKGSSVRGITKVTLPVKITFRSNYPVSFRKLINFKGSEYGECLITLIATADNCLLTTHAFLKTHSPNLQRLKIVDEEKLPPVAGERVGSPVQQMSRQTSKQDSSESDSEISFSATITRISPSFQSCKASRSVHQTQTSKDTNLTELEKDPHFNDSDIQLSLQLSEKEEKQTQKESVYFTEMLMKDEEEPIFPEFPTNKSNENALYMQKTLTSIQQWAYEQVFCCSYFPFIGSHSFSSFSFSNKKDYFPTTSVAMKNIFDVIERICGRRIRRYFTPIEKLPEEGMAKAVFTYSLYRQLLEFLEAQGALMAHVEPKYLMAYDDYCLYHKTMAVTDRYHELLSTGSMVSIDYSPPQLLSGEEFHNISAQCWLDVFLQIFKTLVLGPTVGILYHFPFESGSRNAVNIDKKVVYGRPEETLLSWLTHHFNTQRTSVWPNKPPPSRTITNFDTDLEDGLVLTATTAAYCPYLKDLHFHDMCLHPTTISQAYHNTTCLCMAWDNIKLGFSVTPSDFVHPNMINMLLLVTHLYKVLPSYKPEATITFRATLNACESQIVMLENDEEMSITYHIEILPQSANFFIQGCQNSFVLKRKSKGQITVQYLARNTNKAEAILLLCGACMPPKFGRNYVFKLEGYPVKLPVSSSFDIVCPESLPLDSQITVESPHNLDFKAEESYSYDLWVAFTEPQPGNLNAYNWAKERKRKIPRRVFFFTNTLVVTPTTKKTGTGVLAFKVCCFTQIVTQFWLIFRNPDIGDFIVKLQVTPHKPDPVVWEEVTIECNAKCSCIAEPSFNCNRAAKVFLPCRNLAQWSAVRTMFDLTTSPAEKEFWATYIETNIGFRLLKWMLEEKQEKLNEELEVLFKKSKTYKVSCSSKNVTCMPTFHIPDVRSKSSLPLELHFDEATSSHSTVLTLTSTDSHEIRCCNLKVVVNSKSDDKNTNIKSNLKNE